MSSPNQLLPGDDTPMRPGLPENYKGLHLANSTSSHLKTNTASIVLQRYRSPLFSITYCVSRFLQAIRSLVRIEAPGLYVRFQLKNGQRHTVDDNPFQVREQQFYGFWMQKGQCHTHNQPHKTVECLDIFFTPELLAEFTEIYPELADTMQKEQLVPIHDKPGWTLFEMNEIVRSLLHPTLSNDAMPLYYDLKVRELLTHILHYKYERKPGRYALTPFELERIHEVRNMLMQYISKKPPSLQALARMIGLPEARLREGFRQEFQLNIFDWLLEQKMQYAHEVLNTTDTQVKVVCTMVGYPRVSNFVTAYRRRFGRPPGSLRR